MTDTTSLPGQPPRKDLQRTEKDVLSVEWIKLELLRTAYATRGGVFSKRDPRVVIVWYVVMAIVPWFTHNMTTLALLFVGMSLAVYLARVGPLVLGLFVIGLGFETTYLLVVAWFFEGDTNTVMSLIALTLKLGSVSLASLAAFVSLDPEKLSDALVAFKAPRLLSFGVSYGYRMLPIMIEEFHTIVSGFRLRSAPDRRRGLLGWRAAYRLITMIIAAFYPMMLNTAKRTRTTVEALEARGFTYAGESDEARKLRLSYLQVTSGDIVLLAVTAFLCFAAFMVGATFPLFARDF